MALSCGSSTMSISSRRCAIVSWRRCFIFCVWWRGSPSSLDIGSLLTIGAWEQSLQPKSVPGVPTTYLIFQSDVLLRRKTPRFGSQYTAQRLSDTDVRLRKDSSFSHHERSVE